MTDIFETLATVARTDAERIRAKWEAMSPEERLAQQCREWDQAKLLGSGVPALKGRKSMSAMPAIEPDTIIVELRRRSNFAKGQIMEALGDLATVSNLPEVHRAERALRYAIAELNGKARVGEPREAAQ